MRLLPVFFLTLFVFSPAHAASFSIVRVWPGYRTAESFQRISEYFSGEENPGRQTILRSQLKERNGYYFLARFDNPEALADATVQLDVITPTSAEPRNFTFKTAIAKGSHVVNVGVTGTDWPNPAAHPVAWRLIVRATDGTELAHQQSFLWALPEKPVAVTATN